MAGTVTHDLWKEIPKNNIVDNTSHIIVECRYVDTCMCLDERLSDFLKDKPYILMVEYSEIAKSRLNHSLYAAQNAYLEKGETHATYAHPMDLKIFIKFKRKKHLLMFNLSF